MNALLHNRKAIVRFLRYALVGGSTLLFDLCLLYVVTEYLGVPYFIATPGAFLIAVSINYFISRKFVFKGTERGHSVGYSIFILIALAGAFITTSGVVLLVTYAHLYYLFARVLVACFVGIANYLLNLFFNFRVAGIHH